MIKRVLNATLLALLLMACEQDNVITQQPQTEVEVTFNFEFEDVAVTRAISDGTTADELMYAIFNADNNELVISKTTKTNASGATTSSGITTRMTLPEGLTKLTVDNTTLGKEGINMEYLYAFMARTEKHAYVVLRVEDNAAAEEALGEAGFHLITKEDICKI